MRAKILKIYISLFTIGTIYLIWVLATGTGIPCLYYEATGLLCPGCGVSRMFIDLARLDIAAAFSYNPIVFVLLIIWNLIALLCFVGKPQCVQTSKFLYTSLGMTLAVLSVWGIVRNIY